MFSDPPFVLRIGVESPALRELHREHGGTSAFITAFNPYSQQLTESENLARNEALKVDLLAAGCVVIPGVGKHPSGVWPGEPSFLALKINPGTAKELGQKYEQNAIVFNDIAGKSELLLLR